MKNLPLFMQIWIAIAAITIGISALLAMLFPWTLRDFFTKEIYATIENAQRMFLTDDISIRAFGEEGSFQIRQQLESVRSVNHLVLLGTNRVISSTQGAISAEFLAQIREEVTKQQVVSSRYGFPINDRRIFYVIYKEQVLGWDIAVVSYMWDSYRDDLVQTLFQRLVSILILVLILSWIPAILLARYLSKPLTSLGNHVRRLAARDWGTPIQLQRKDEIGVLGDSVEQLRKQIILQDEAQKALLQHTSHELKTPIMVIRSYAQAIADGVYPQGDLESTIKVIEQEGERLDKRVRDLLYVTKLDFLATQTRQYHPFDFTQMTEDVIERMRWKRVELDWEIDLEQVAVTGDREQWQIALENIFDNQIRYASKAIKVSLKELRQQHTEEGMSDSLGKIELTIWNDGPHIEDTVLERLFGQFTKGEKGEFGLGLAIVQRIVMLHDATVSAVNEDQGVTFRIII